jgi:hypothetical protein
MGEEEAFRFDYFSSTRPGGRKEKSSQKFMNNDEQKNNQRRLDERKMKTKLTRKAR